MSRVLKPCKPYDDDEDDNNNNECTNPGRHVTRIIKFCTGHLIDVGPQYDTRVVTLIVATIYLQLIQNRYMFRSFTVLQCSHQHCVQPVASDVEVVGYL